MRNIDSNILTELASSTLRPFDTVEFIIDGEAYRYTDCDVPITLVDDKTVSVEDMTLRVGEEVDDDPLGNAVPSIYTPVEGLKYNPIKYSSGRIVDKATVTIPVIDLPDMILAFGGGTPQGSLAIIRKVLVDDDGSLIGDTSAMIFEGTIDSWVLTEDKLKVDIVSQFVQWNLKALRLHSPSCSWKVFKGTSADSPCRYSGEEVWCDRTYSRCNHLGNTDNFGGFRWLPSIVDKEIWWGREQNK